MAADLDAIRARCEAAVKGPWECWPLDRQPVGPDDDPDDIEWTIGADLDGTLPRPSSWTNVAAEVYGATAEFIVHARSDVPELVTEVEKLRAERRQLRRLLGRVKRDQRIDIPLLDAIDEALGLL